MGTFVRLTVIAFLTAVLIGCAEVPKAITGVPRGGNVRTVRTTAYTHDEGSGGRNAVGRRLASAGIKSAASDWSRYPLGTHFRIIGTKDEYMIDDYGGALVGTNTIDLYTPSRAVMHRWGVRHVQIEILAWGSEQESLHVLQPRKNTRLAKRMIASLESKQRKL
ncbi:MAG: 3D domain-containing protein [Verrucomicrobiota bacterium]|nr:3D domain-containing protein [Verrucomicrobiota bacterium]